jgi:hypothetical protein
MNRKTHSLPFLALFQLLTLNSQPLSAPGRRWGLFAGLLSRTKRGVSFFFDVEVAS